MNWINTETENEKPTSPWHIVFVTNGEVTWLARWISDPKYWYGEELTEYDENTHENVPLEKEWHDPHWLYIQEVGPFLENDECFLFNSMDDVTHWMPLPKTPKKGNSL